MRVGEVAPDGALRQGGGSALWTSAGPLRRTEDLRDPESAPDRRQRFAFYRSRLALAFRVLSSVEREPGRLWSRASRGAASAATRRSRNVGRASAASLRSPLPADERSFETFARPSLFSRSRRCDIFLRKSRITSRIGSMRKCRGASGSMAAFRAEERFRGARGRRKKNFALRLLPGRISGRKGIVKQGLIQAWDVSELN